MFYWQTITVPYFVPTNGQVLLWLLIGMATLLFLAVHPTARYREVITKATAVEGYGYTLIILCLGPISAALVASNLISKY